MSKFEILQSRKEDYETSRSAKCFDHVYACNVPIWSINVVIDVALKFIIHACQIAVVAVRGLWLRKGTINIGEFLALISVVYLFDRILTQFANLYKEFSKNIVEVEKMRTTFDTIPEIVWYSKWEPFVFKKWEIKLDKISFAYEDDETIFSKFSLTIKPGQKTALVGPSWGGKSTLIKLIAGYTQPDKWEIIVDGQKLSKSKLSDYYQHIWYLTQEPGVFDGSIRENLMYGVLEGRFNKTSLQEVIKLAKCEFINKFPKGLDTEIGERGIRLSGGQKQRLAIAKIMLKNPEIILLDEPTSALDSVSEQKISEALHNLFKWKTVVVIAHRLQTVKEANEIIVIEQWKITEKGTHSELEKLWGIYSQMLELQTTF